MSEKEQVRIKYFEEKIDSLIKKGEFKKANEVIDRLESSNIDLPSLIFLKVLVFEQENKWFEIERILKQALLNCPNNLKMLKKLVETSEKLNLWYQAADCLQQIEKSYPEEKDYIVVENNKIKIEIDRLNKTKTQIKKVLFIQDIQCTRTNKIASALKRKGIQVDALYLKLHPAEMYKGIILPYTNYFKLEDINETINFINNSDYDILYSSNEPDYLTVLFTATNKPIIHDTHDMMSLRGNLTIEQTILEYIANKNSNGNIYVTNPVKEIAIRRFGIDEKPIATINNYIDRDYLPNKFNEKLSEKDGEIHCVFEGGLAGVEGHHRYLEPYFLKLTNYNIHVHIFGHVDPGYIKSLEKKSSYIHYEGVLPPHKLIEEMTKFDIGLLIFNLNERNKVFLDTTFANKVWDYLAAGLPIAFADLKIYNDFLKEHNVGKIINFDTSITDQINEIIKINIAKDYLVKNNLLMDQQIDKIIDLFEKVIKNYINVSTNNKSDKEMKSSFYNQLYESGGYGKAYHKHYSETLYFPSWKKSLELVKNNNSPKILEIGCGPGQFAQLLFDNKITNYVGMDFSENAIKLAKSINRDNSDKFLVQDVYTTNLFEEVDYNIVILFEVLEHISEDIKILQKIKSDSSVLFSVPNFDSKSHVRYFKDENHVIERYKGIIDIKQLFTFNISETNKIFLVEGKKK